MEDRRERAARESLIYSYSIPAQFDRDSRDGCKEADGMAMTSRQRFLKALNGEMPDRVPVTLFVMQPVDFLEYGTPPENVRAYVETALERAWY